MKTKLITTLTGAALALGIFSQSDLATAALGCKYTFSVTPITRVGNFLEKTCQDNSARGSVQLDVIAATNKTYKIFSNLLKADTFSSRMRLTTQNGSTLNCDLVDQALDNTAKSLFCTFPNATPATTAIFNAGDSVGN